MKRFLSLIVCLWALCSLSTAQNAAPEWSNILSDQPERIRTQLISSSERSIQVNVQVPGFYTTNVQTPRGEAKVITMPKAISTAKAGEPNVPMTGIPVMIGDRARMNVRVIDAQYMDFEGIEVAPSKGDFPRSIDPATVPYTYGECYNQDAFFPANNVGLYDPYIIRDFRGQNMVVYPFAYNPVTKTLRVYYDMTVEMYKLDDRGANVMETRRSNTVKMDPDFKSVYQRHFINYEAGMAKYTPVDEEGDLLIICYDNFISSMTDFVNWKKTRGINTTIVGTSTAGSSSSAIQTYIRNQYNANNNLTHVLLVGDVAQIPGYTYSGASGYEGKGDNPYGQIVGNDIYNDVFIGRFSASSATQVTTQVNRTITYERDLTTSDTWCQNGLGISTTEGSGGHNNEDDYQHIEKLRTDLLNYSYSTVYQDYYNVNGYPSSSTTTISNHINSGVGIINYCNHGEETGWQSHYYMNANVNALTNNNKLPFIFSVACLVGKYDHSTECFAETWMHATNGNNPTGAIGGAFSYISQPWIPPMWAQDEFVDILCELKNNNIKRTLGGAMVNGMMAIFDNYSTSNASAVGTYQAWITYGDPTLMMRTKTPQAMTVTHNGNISLGTSSYTVNVSNGNGTVATITDSNHNILGKATVSNGTASISLNSSNLTAGSQLTLCVFGYNKVTYLGTINVVGGTQYNITANVNPANSGTVEGAGQYYQDTECTLTATPNHGYAFDNWKQGNTVVSTEPTYTFTVTGNATYTANFHALTQHSLTYNPQQTHGTISVSPTNAYAGDIITLTATPDAGYCLDQWHVTTGRAEIPVVNNQFTMPDSDVTITATFKSGYTVTVATVANGTITANPTSAMPGDIITLTATPNTGCEFMAWNAYKTGDPNTAVTVFNNTIRMPSYDVTVSAVFATSTIADPITIGSGTSTNQYLPTYTYYNYSLTQQIYTAAELGEAGSITAIAFQVGNSKASTRNLSIYMRPTDLTAFSSTTGWETMGDVYLVYAGSVAFSASGWTTIQLDTPFKYDGVKNVNICVVDNSGSYDTNGNYPYFRVYSTGANRAMRVYNDNNEYSVGTSDQISTYTGTYVTSNNQIQITKKLVNAETITVSPTTIEGLSYVQGEGPSETKVVDVTGVDLSNNITVTAPNGFEISTTANGTYGTSLTIPRATSKGGRATQTWGFEGSMENWTNVDADGDTWGWVLGSAVGGVYLAAGSNLSEGHSGSDMMVSGSYSNVNGVLTPDNWLISPQVELGGTFSMWAKGQDASWFAEHFGIYVSTTNNSISSFQALNEWTLSSGEWKQYSVDLSFFAGQTGYIAIRHFNCTNMFMIDVDDFELNTEATFTPDLPVVITPATVYVRLQDGLDPDTYSGNMTFVAGSVNATVALNGEVLPGSGEQYTVTVEASPANGGTVAGGGTFYEGSHHNLTATPAAHYTFTGWQLNGSIVSTDNPYNITVTGDATYTAVFTEMSQYNVAVNQTEGGTITADPTTAYPGDVVTLTVSENSGYFFVEWNVVDANNQTVTVTNNQFTMPESNVTVTAVFTSGFEVTLIQTANGSIGADKTTAIQPGETVTLTATPDNGCVFLAWYVYKTGSPRDVISVVNDEWFFMPSSDVTVQAIFVTEEEHEQTIGSGTSTNSYLPTYVYRRNVCHSLTQQIYTAAEIGYNGRITAIAFKANGSVTRNLDIYMAHTDKTAFSSTTDWEVMGSVAKVFSGSVSFTNNWTTITLDTPFEYDGTSNLNICVVDVTSGQVSNTRAFSAYSTGANRAMYVYSTGNSATDYSAVIGYSNQLESTTGTRSTSNNQIKFTIKVPGSAESLTVSPDALEDFSYVEGQGPSATNKLGIVGVDLSNDITLTAPANFEISLTEDGTYSNSLTIARETGSKGNRDVQTWDFEDGLQGWTVADADGDGYNWAHSTSFEGHDGSTGIIFSQSYDNNAGVLTPDNWLISPQVTLGGSFSMWAHPQQAAYPAEHFAILVSTTNTNADSFTLLGEWTLSSGDWKQFSVDLSAFAGQTGYIAVRHYNCTDQFYINVDDFVLDTDAAITIEMPVTITPATVYVRMAAGLEQGTYSGTLNAAAGNDFTGSVSLAGEVIFPSFIKHIIGYATPEGNGSGNYELIASPIGTVAPGDVTNMLENSYDLYYFDQDTDGNGNEWINYKGDPTHPMGGFDLEIGKGYLYANSNSIDLVFTGRPIAQSSYTVTLKKTVGARFAGWNLVGNPFTQTAYVDNAHNAFYTMNSDGTAFIGITSNTVDPMEGIFVTAATDGETLTFSTSDPNDAKCSTLALNLTQGQGLLDRATVRFDEGCQLPKLQFNRNSSKVYFPMDGNDYAVVRCAEMGEMPLNFKAESNGTYCLTLGTDNVEFAYLHLVDNLTGNDVDLLQTPSYTFDARTTDYESRFKLVFATGNNGNDDNFAFFSNGSFVINNEGEATLQVIDVTGRVLKSETINGCANVNVDGAAGVYMLRLINGDNMKVQKVVVR